MAESGATRAGPPAPRPPASPLPAYLRKRHAGWRATEHADNRSWFQNLAEVGQHPRAMLVSCCDSRVNAVSVFGAEPGDLFVVRNVANLVPPHAPDQLHHGTSAAVEYAVRVLRVAHIVVVGHSQCGGVKACHDMCEGGPTALEGAGTFVSRWMDLLRPGYERVAARGGEPEARLRDLEREAVVTSLANLVTFPFVAEAVAAGTLSLHGTWLDIATGHLAVYDPATGAFA